MKRPNPSPQGATLMLAMWALLTLALIVFAWAKWVRQDVTAAMESSLAVEARALAHSGIAVALHPMVSATSPLLTQRQDEIHGYHVRIESEGGRINLNFMLAGEDPVRLQFLKNYFTQRGLKPVERDALLDALLDWVGPVGARRLNAPRASADYHPPHRPFQSIEELRDVKGAAPLLENEKWRDAFTVWSSGPLDLKSVTAETLGALPGLGVQKAEAFLQARDGRENEPNRHPLENLDACLAALRLTPKQLEQLGPLLSFRDPIVRIHSEGRAASVARTVEVVARKPDGETSELLQWIEK